MKNYEQEHVANLENMRSETKMVRPCGEKN